MIPFASGIPVTPSTAAGLGLIAGLVGFGDALAQILYLSTDPLSLNMTTTDFAFASPVAGSLIQLNGVVTVTLSAAILSPSTLFVEIWKSSAGGTNLNNFVSTTFGASITIGPTVVLLQPPVNFSATATSGTFPVAVGDRLLLVVRYVTQGIDVAIAATYVSAGLLIQ